jgi:thymidylate synthase
MIKMMYTKILNKILEDGIYIERKLPLISLYNYNLQLNNIQLENLINLISINRKKRFKTEFNLFLSGQNNVNIYNYFNIPYWDYIGEKFINSYPKFYPKFNDIQKDFKEDSKNYVLFLGNNEYSNQQPCISAIQFQNHNNKLYISVLQRSCDANLGFLADVYHLNLFAQKLNINIENINILYGNIHIYKNNIEETKRYIKENGKNKPYKFIQNNLKR